MRQEAHADRKQAKAGSPAATALWAALAVLLSLAAAAQLAFAYRDLVATHWPQTRPLWDEVCHALGCRIEPPRRMAALSVEGSNLRQRNGEASYDLLVNVRNRSEWPVMMPAFELTLTDTQGQPLIRRVLKAADLGARSDLIGAGAEVSLQAALDINDRRVAGYTVEIFYP